MAALSVPTQYRTDLFVTRLKTGSAFELGLLSGSAVAACWAKYGTGAQLLRVWHPLGSGEWPGAQSTQAPLAYGMQLTTSDVFAIPKAWGDPAYDKPCWNILKTMLITKVEIDPATSSLTSHPWFPPVDPVNMTWMPGLPGASPGADKGGGDKGLPMASPELQAAFDKYAAVLSQPEILAIVSTFGCASSDAACLATFIAGSGCPGIVDQAQKAGVLAAAVRANKDPGVFCGEVRLAVAQGPQTSPAASTWLKVAVVAGVISTAIAVVAFVEREKPKKNPVTPRPRAGYAFTAPHSESFGRIADDGWDNEAMSASELSGARYVGDRRIDGVWMNVWQLHGDRFAAQTAFD